MLDWITLGAASAAGYGCFCRLHQMHWRTHRIGMLAGHALAAVTCILIGSAAAQAAANLLSLGCALAIGSLLVITLPDWPELARAKGRT